MLARATFLIALLLGCITAQAQFPSQSHSFGNNSQADVSVSVHTSQGLPAENARVELRNLNTGMTAQTGYTNGSGVAELNSVASGSYDVIVTYKLSEVRQRAQFSFGDRSLSLRLPVADADAAGVGSAASVSVAQYQVPDKARKEFNKAQEFLNKGKNDEAYDHLEKALKIYPAFADALTLHAIIRMDRQDRQGAMNELDAAIKADPSCSLAYFAMGASFNAEEKFDDAVRTLQRGLTLAPNSWQGYFELGKALVGKGEYRDGIAQMEKAQSFIDVAKYPAIHLVKAHAYLALKQYPVAMKELQNFLSEAPNDARSANAKETLDRVSAFVGGGAIALK